MRSLPEGLEGAAQVQVCPMNTSPIDDAHRSLICAIVIRALRDTTRKDLAQEATEFLLCDECRSILLAAGIKWNVTQPDIEAARTRVVKRSRHWNVPQGIGTS